MRIKEIDRISSLSLSTTSLVAAPAVPNKQQKKKEETRMKIACELQLLRRLNVGNVSNQMLLPGGAVLADRDGLKTEVMVSGRFLRSECFSARVIRLFMTVQQPSDLYIMLTPERR